METQNEKSVLFRVVKVSIVAHLVLCVVFQKPPRRGGKKGVCPQRSGAVAVGKALLVLVLGTAHTDVLAVAAVVGAQTSVWAVEQVRLTASTL